MKKEIENNFELYDFLPIGICIIDESYEIKYWNKRLASWTGLEKDESEGKNLLELYPNLSKPAFKMRIDLMFEGHPPTYFSSLLHKYFLPVKVSENELQVQSTTLISIPKKNSTKNLVLISIENETNLHQRFQKYKQMKNKATTELNKRVEAEKRINEYVKQLEETNASKDKFFSIIAHDLKSPFSGFLNLTKILSEQLNFMTINEISEMSSALKESANTLFKLLENLLEWSRIQRGLIKHKPEKLSLNYIAKNNIDIQYETAKQKKIEILNKINEDIEVYADVSMVNTILRNLLSNAVKFSFEDGFVEIEAITKDDFAVVSVKDSGIVIPKDKLDKIFNIGESYTNPGTSGEPSTGLGLVLCKEFVQLNGGRISVNSTEGSGSIFTFTLPLSSEH
jgi:PAS domain S-box-containing protein